MLLNCGVGEDSWESLGLQGDPTSPFRRRSALGFLWREWCWSWNSSFGHLMRRVDSLEKSRAGRYWGQEEKGTSQDEMAGWHHRLDGRESEWTPGVSDGQGGLARCDSWGHKVLDTTEGLNWQTELMQWLTNVFLFKFLYTQKIQEVTTKTEAKQIWVTRDYPY